MVELAIDVEVIMQVTCDMVLLTETIDVETAAETEEITDVTFNGGGTITLMVLTGMADADVSTTVDSAVDVLGLEELAAVGADSDATLTAAVVVGAWICPVSFI